jgi:ribonuclease P protein component
MLPKAKRLSQKEVPLVSKDGYFFSFPYFSVRSLKNPIHPKYAVVVGKSVAKHAVGRNTLRRRIYTLIGDTLKKNPIPYSLVFFMKKGSGAVSFTELESGVDEVMKKLRVK